MKKVDGHPRSLSDILQNNRYAIHYYQREYKWHTKQIEELIDDLTSEFLENYTPGDTREDVDKYGIYFMGPVVLAGFDKAIVDGQQRLTSLTLLLIYLRNRITKLGLKEDTLNQMISSSRHGKQTFNINVSEREECMNALYNEDVNFDVIGKSESVINLWARYQDVKENFPDEIDDSIILNFIDWIYDKVYFIEIVTDNEQDAHKVFITMNDRGLRLSSTEMLKGYLLAEIVNDNTRRDLNDLWKKTVLNLKKYGDDTEEVFIKNWLRAQYAVTIRQNKANAAKEDFDLIGGPFHKWVTENKEKVHIQTPSECEEFIKRLVKYAEVFEKIKEAETQYTDATRYAFYNAKLEFTFQMQMILAAVDYKDSNATIIEKINLVARFIDLFINSRVTNYNSCSYNYIKNAIFNITKVIRNNDIITLKNNLLKEYQKLGYDADYSIPKLRLNSFTKRYIKNMLARITSHLERESKTADHYSEYMNFEDKNPYEIEHILCDHFTWFNTEYVDENDFYTNRNSIGALLLLRKSINASLRDKLYKDKVDIYGGTQSNIYAGTLEDRVYQNNPQFVNYINNNNLNFTSLTNFGKNEIKTRIELVTQLVKLIWNEDMFK